MTDLATRTVPAELTDEQRDLVREFFDQHPDGGYKAACRAAGIRQITKAEAKQLIDQDDELHDHRLRALGVDEDSAWLRVALIAQNLEHKDALRANTFILGAIHGRTDQAGRLEVVGAGGGPVEVTNPDVAAAIERFTALADAAVRAASRGTAEPAALPAA